VGSGGGGGINGTGGGVGTGGAGGINGTGGGVGTGGAGGGVTSCEVDTNGVCVFPDGGIEIEDPEGNPAICYLIQCENRITACGDCEDNDGDGKIDVYDPECLGPCDNYEGPELLTGVGGETGEQCKADCYFDFGNGAGNDTCRWSRSCDPLGPKTQCSYDAGKLGSPDCPDEQTQLCNDFCAPLTPNGCDCFGCCTFPELAGAGPNGGPGYVYIGSEEGCTFATVTDPSHCRACTPAASCLNTCEKCEICIGKPTIPEECFPPDPGGTGGAGGTGGTGGSAGSAGSAGTAGAGGSEPPPPPPPPRCPPGKQACGLPGDSPCPPGSFCITGCCADIVVQ
jgi:hypothetical protein